jgi:DNA-cytosine methyltransferase
MMLRHGSLFTGLGGFDLAASWCGWENVFQVEIDPFCNSILARHFPQTERYLNVKEFEAEKYKGSIDVLTGGFPCQPFSINGKRKGKEDERWLWGEMRRVYNDCRPTWIVGENVNGLTSKDEFGSICNDLEEDGYKVWPCLIPASSLGARHRRRRVWFICQRQKDNMVYSDDEHSVFPLPEAILQDASSTGLDSGDPLLVWNRPMPSPTGFCGVADGVPARLDRLFALGNGLVPQVAYCIFRAIEAFDPPCKGLPRKNKCH